MLSDIPLSLYVHFPWCVQKCPYCDFNSHELSAGEVPESVYIDALLQDLSLTLASFPETRPLKSIFMGGGTPSLFSPEAIQHFMKTLKSHINIEDGAEITLEANPGTTDFEKFAGYRKAGINRLSIGVQSFTGAHLTALGRIHTANEATLAFQAARDAGFDNINLDLMHGLPDQNLDNALFDLETAIELKPEHISWYQLTIEPNTVFYNRPPELPEDGHLWEIYEAGLEKLEAAGYKRYEVSAFARENLQSAHNLNYWQFGDYLGIGAGAHGKITTQKQMVRTAKTRLPKDYLNNQKILLTPVEKEDLLLEFLMNTLRLTNGFDKVLFEQRTGLARHRLDDFVLRATKMQLLEVDHNQIRPTQKGLQFLNDLLLLAS